MTTTLVEISNVEEKLEMLETVAGLDAFLAEDEEDLVRSLRDELRGALAQSKGEIEG